MATGPKASGIGFPRGTAPVYVGLGTKGTVLLDSRSFSAGWYHLKMVVAVDPFYHDRFVITAHQQNGPAMAKFQFKAQSGLKTVTRLVYPANASPSPRGWHYGVATLVIRLPGRYVLFFRGPYLNEAIPFRTALG